MVGYVQVVAFVAPVAAGDQEMAMAAQESEFARDQYGDPWIVFDRNGDRWALGMDGDFPILRCLYGGAEIQTDLSRPHAFRRLAIVNTTAAPAA